MNIRVKTTRYKMIPSAREYLEVRLEALEKLLGEDAATARCEVELGKASGKTTSDYMWYAELHLLPVGGKPLYAKNHAATVLAAIDDVKEEMARQVRKERTRTQDAKRKKGREIKRTLKR